MDSLFSTMDPSHSGVFQWGHDFPAMDRIVMMAISMAVEAFQWGHDFPAMDRAHGVMILASSLG